MGAAKHTAQLPSLSPLCSHTLVDPLHDMSACMHAHTHTMQSEDQRLIMPFHQLHHPLLYLSLCLMVMFMCVCTSRRRLSAVVGAFLSSLVDTLKAPLLSDTVNKQSCPPLPLFLCISTHLLKVFSLLLKPKFSVYISWFNGSQAS